MHLLQRDQRDPLTLRDSKRRFTGCDAARSSIHDHSNRSPVATLELPPAERTRALHALRAGLHAIRDRLPAAEVVDLGAQLPTLIRGFYYESWTLANDPTRMRDRAEMIARVKKELMLDPRMDPVDVLRAVIHLLVEHVSPGEIRHLVSTLPRPIASLWQDLTGHALDTLGANQP